MSDDRDDGGRFVEGNGAGASTRFAPGNAAALKHGVRRFEARGEAALPPDLRMSVAEFQQQVIADRGGAEGLSAIERAYITRLGEVETVSRLLASDLAVNGLFTAKRRVRSTFVRWLECLDRWDRMAQRVGAERKQKRAPTPHEYWQQRSGEQRANEAGTD